MSVGEDFIEAPGPKHGGYKSLFENLQYLNLRIKGTSCYYPFELQYNLKKCMSLTIDKTTRNILSIGWYQYTGGLHAFLPQLGSPSSIDIVSVLHLPA